MKVKTLSDNTVKFFIVFIGLVILGILLKELQHIFIPFVVAYFLFFVFAPLNTYLEKKEIPLGILIILDLFILVVVIGGASRFFIDSIIQFTQDIDSYYSKLNSIVRLLSKSIGIDDPFFKYFSLQRVIAKLDYKLLASGILTYTFDLMGSIFFVLFFFIFIEGGHGAIINAFKKRYIVSHKKKKQKKADKKLNSELKHLTDTTKIEVDDKLGSIEVEEKLEGTFKKITEQIQKYIIVKIGMNLLAGVLVTVVCIIFDVDFPIIWGTFTFLLNFIPTIGSAVALIFPTLMTLIQYEAIGYALLFAAFIALVQTLIFNILEPKVIGKRLNLNPIVILLSVLVWGYIWGVIGMFLAVPLTAIIKIILSNSESRDVTFMADLMNQE